MRIPWGKGQGGDGMVVVVGWQVLFLVDAEH